MVWVIRLELTTSASRTLRATNCATPRYYILYHMVGARRFELLASRTPCVRATTAPSPALSKNGLGDRT